MSDKGKLDALSIMLYIYICNLNLFNQSNYSSFPANSRIFLIELIDQIKQIKLLDPIELIKLTQLLHLFKCAVLL